MNKKRNNKLKKEYYKKLSQKRGEHNIERKKHQYNPFGIVTPEYTKFQENYKPAKRKVVDVPTKFNLIENPIGIMNFLDESKHQVEDLGKRILHDFRYIECATPDAILYMLSYIDDMKFRKVPYSIQGKYPNDKNCAKIFKESGFIEHLKEDKEQFKNIKTDLLTVKIGNKVDSEIAKKVVQYVRKWLDLEIKDTKPVYKILIECMANTFNHAYKQSTDKNHKWYLMAYHLNNEVHFVFLDNGSGIPQTLRTNWKDIFSGSKWDDSKLVLSALEGKILRSQTGEIKRGKGLPLIYKTAQNTSIKELIIMTNKALINCKDGKTIKLQDKFKGTVLSWKFKKDNHNG